VKREGKYGHLPRHRARDLNMGTTIQYRLVGDAPSTGEVAPTEPGLEDSYVWLMREPAPSLQPPGLAETL
jgi:hypothetical protein